MGISCIETKHKSKTGQLGYGTIQINGKRFYIHRLVAMVFHGLELQDTKSIVMHSCDNPRCINPDHLSVGTQGENVRDCISKGRFIARGLPGEKNPKAKLTWEKVRQIRLISQMSSRSYKQIADEFGVSPAMISGICRGFFWKE